MVTGHIIIVTFNAMAWIERCLDAAIEWGEGFRVLVVDNASNDGTVAFIKGRYDAVEVIETGENLGFGKANNIGIRRALDAGAEAILLLNQDAYISKGMLQELASVAMRHPEYAILSPVQTNGTGEGFDANFGAIVGRELGWDFASLELTTSIQDGSARDMFEVPFVMAAVWYMPVQAVRTIGCFDPLFNHYGEDDDMVTRVHWHGLKVGICPRARAAHDRESRAPSAERTLAIMYASYLCTLKNILRPWAVCVLRFAFCSSAKLVKLVFCGRTALAAIQWRNMRRLVAMFADIRRSRQICKAEGAFLKV